MKVIDFVIEASQAGFGWSARHECCLMPEVHTVQPNCEVTVKARERDVPAQLLWAWPTSCSDLLQLLWGYDFVGLKKKEPKNINASTKYSARARLCFRRRWPRNFERSWPDLTERQTSQTPDSGGNFERMMNDFNKLRMSAHRNKRKADGRESCDRLSWSLSRHRRATGCSTPRKRLGSAQVNHSRNGVVEDPCAH